MFRIGGAKVRKIAIFRRALRALSQYWTLRAKRAENFDMLYIS